MASSLTRLAGAVNVYSHTRAAVLVVDLLRALIQALLGDAGREITLKELAEDIPSLVFAGLLDAHADATGYGASGYRASDGGDDSHRSRAELLEGRSVREECGRPLGGCTYLEEGRDGDDRNGCWVGGQHCDCWVGIGVSGDDVRVGR